MSRKIRLLSAVLVGMVLLLFPVIGSAEGEGKTLIVDDDGGTGRYTTIQEAIDYIAGLSESDRAGWTITVKAGTYDRFTVPFGLTNLTIQGESKTGVIVNTLNKVPDSTTDDPWDNYGINVHGTNVTLKNMTIQAGDVDYSSKGLAAAVSTHHGASGGAGVSLTVEDCILDGTNAKALYGILWDCDRVEVKNCRIYGFSNAIEFMCDNYSIPDNKMYSITGNTITNCSYAIHGYMGGGKGGGTLEISSNTISGTDARRAKVIVQQNKPGTLKADIKNNQFENVVIGTVNLREEGETVSNPLTSNTLGKNCFYVDAIEPGTIDFYSHYQAPAGEKGSWKLTGLEDFEVDWGKNPEGTLDYIKKKVAEANAAGENTLHLTGIDKDKLVRTFTWFKDGIYWETEKSAAPTPSSSQTIYYPDYSEEPNPTPTPTAELQEIPEEVTVGETSPKTGQRSGDWVLWLVPLMGAVLMCGKRYAMRLTRK